MDTRISSPREQGAPAFSRDTEHGQQTDNTDHVLPAIILKQKHQMERVNLDNIVACVPFQLPPIVNFSSHVNNQGEPLFSEELENNSFKVSGHTLRQKKYLKSKVPKRMSPQNVPSPTFNYKHPNHSYVTSSKVILQSKSSAEKVQQWINENIPLPAQNRLDISHKRRTNQRRVLPNILQESTNTASLVLKRTGSDNSYITSDHPEKSRTRKTNMPPLQNGNTCTNHKDQPNRCPDGQQNSPQCDDKTNSKQNVHLTTCSESFQNSSTKSKQSSGEEQLISESVASQDLQNKEADRIQNRSPVSLQHIHIKCNVDKLKISGNNEIGTADTTKTPSNPDDPSTTSKIEIKNKCNKNSKDIDKIHHSQNKKDSKVNNTSAQNKKKIHVSSENEDCEKCSDNNRKENKKIINTEKTARNHNPTPLSSDNSSSDSDNDDSVSSSSSSNSSFSETSDDRNKTKRRTKNKNSGKRIPLKVNKKANPVTRSGKRRKCKRVRWAVRLVKIRYFQKDERSSSDDSNTDDESD